MKKIRERGNVKVVDLWGYKWVVDDTMPSDKVIVYDREAAKLLLKEKGYTFEE